MADHARVPDFVRVIEEGVALQEALPWLQAVAVGGTAAAIHARHRYSTDIDHFTPFLRERFALAADQLEAWQGWRTNRVNALVLILGERHGVELGVRQLRRRLPLEVTRLHGLWVPTPAEALRIKAALAAERRATRDFLDVAALADGLGEAASLDALSYLNLLYEPIGNQTRLTKFVEACHQDPLDLAGLDLAHYRGIRAPYDDWHFVSERCRRLARPLLVREMEGSLPESIDAILRSPHFQPRAQPWPPAARAAWNIDPSA